MAQLELLNALNSITSEAELNEFKNLLAHYFAQKAQKAIEATGITRNLGARSFDATLRAATNQAKEASKSAGSLLRAILMMMGRSIDAR